MSAWAICSAIYKDTSRGMRNAYVLAKFKRSVRLIPCMYSIAMKKFPSIFPRWNTCTILGCLSLSATFASSRNIFTNEDFCLSWGSIFFIATIFPDSTSRALNISAIPPTSTRSSIL